MASNELGHSQLLRRGDSESLCHGSDGPGFCYVPCNADCSDIRPSSSGSRLSFLSSLIYFQNESAINSKADALNGTILIVSWSESNLVHWYIQVPVCQRLWCARGYQAAGCTGKIDLDTTPLWYSYWIAGQFVQWNHLEFWNKLTIVYFHLQSQFMLL